MFFKMALPLCLLLFIGSSLSAPAHDLSTEPSTHTESPQSSSSTPINWNVDDEDTTTTKRYPSKSDLDAVALTALKHSIGKGDFYDQRQDGEFNVHVKVDNATVYFVMVDGLGELSWRKGNKNKPHKNVVKSLLSNHVSSFKRSRNPTLSTPISLSNSRASINAVSASPPAAVSASTPSPPNATTPVSKPPRSTYKPPTETKPEQSHASVIAIPSILQKATTTNAPETTTKHKDATTTVKEIQDTSTTPSSVKPPLQIATAKGQARSEEQKLSILNLLKRTATLTAHSGTLKRHYSAGHQSR